MKVLISAYVYLLLVPTYIYDLRANRVKLSTNESLPVDHTNCSLKRLEVIIFTDLCKNPSASYIFLLESCTSTPYSL